MCVRILDNNDSLRISAEDLVIPEELERADVVKRLEKPDGFLMRFRTTLYTKNRFLLDTFLFTCNTVYYRCFTPLLMHRRAMHEIA